MKPRKGLKPTELKRGKPLVRRTELKRGPVKPRRHPGPQSPTEKRCRELVPKRSDGVCEVRVPGVCVGRASVASHRKRRSQSSPAEKWCPTNVLHGCLPCELHLTRFGATAGVRANGWTVHPSLDPAAVPVLRRGQYVWLTPDGGFGVADLSTIAEWIGVTA